jgi:hypothetical protein
VIVGVPVHDPAKAVSVWPTVAVPETAGGTVLLGGAATTIGLAADAAIAEPAAFDAATTTSKVSPT